MAHFLGNTLPSIDPRCTCRTTIIRTIIEIQEPCPPASDFIKGLFQPRSLRIGRNAPGSYASKRRKREGRDGCAKEERLKQFRPLRVRACVRAVRATSPLDILE
jgi:hypothetical protein